VGLTPAIEDIEISESLAEFYNIRKHYLVLSDAGKPLYTRYGDEMILAPFFATLSAVIPKIQSYFWDN
jgi:vacuolar fusion protein MON1